MHLAGARGDRLTDVSVTVHAGTTAVIGRSGAGKSSLLHVLAGFETPTHGSVQANLGTGTERLPLFWSPQDGGLWPHLSVLAHLEAVAPLGRHGDEIPESIIKPTAIQSRVVVIPVLFWAKRIPEKAK